MQLQVPLGPKPQLLLQQYCPLHFMKVEGSVLVVRWVNIFNSKTNAMYSPPPREATMTYGYNSVMKINIVTRLTTHKEGTKEKVVISLHPPSPRELQSLPHYLQCPIYFIIVFTLLKLRLSRAVLKIFHLTINLQYNRCSFFIMPVKQN